MTLEAIHRGEAAMGLTGASVGGRSCVAAEHLRGVPAGETHEVGLVAALGAPAMGKGVRNMCGCRPLMPASSPQRRTIWETPLRVSASFLPIHRDGRALRGCLRRTRR
jgi:hypothetical protein